LAAGAAGHWEGRVAQAYDDLVQRQAHHLGGGLCDDGVAAGADVGHVRLDRDHSAVIEPHPGGGLAVDVAGVGGRAAAERHRLGPSQIARRLYLEFH
jgi:hypothetical protein